MESLSNILGLAVLECMRNSTEIDVFEAPNGHIKYIFSSFRKNSPFIYKITSENGKIIIKDSKGKIIRNPHKKEVKAVEKKKPSKYKNI